MASHVAGSVGKPYRQGFLLEMEVSMFALRNAHIVDIVENIHVAACYLYF